MIFIFLFSCVSVKQQKLDDILPLQSTKSLEGTYNLYKEFTTVWKDSLKEEADTSEFHKISCKITSISKTEILVKNFLNDSCISKEFIKGRIKDNFFVSRRKAKIVPLVVYNTWESSQSQYSLKSNQGLRIERVNSDGGWVLIVAGGHYWHSVSEYLRLADN